MGGLFEFLYFTVEPGCSGTNTPVNADWKVKNAQNAKNGDKKIRLEPAETKKVDRLDASRLFILVKVDEPNFANHQLRFRNW